MKTIVCDHDVDATVEEWRGNALLYQALLATGYRCAQQIFTSKQVELIFEYIGRP